MKEICKDMTQENKEKYKEEKKFKKLSKEEKVIVKQKIEDVKKLNF